MSLKTFKPFNKKEVKHNEIKMTIIVVVITLISLIIALGGSYLYSKSQVDLDDFDSFKEEYEAVKAEVAADENNPIVEDIDEDKNNIDVIDLTSVDFDLTSMENHDAIATLSTIVGNFETYLGNVIKLTGQVEYTPIEGKNFYSIYIYDEDGCSQGIEIRLLDESDYPEAGETITITGILTMDEQNEHTALAITNAVRDDLVNEELSSKSNE